MPTFEFSASVNASINFALEADDYDSALDFARGYLNLKTNKYVESIELLEEDISIESVSAIYMTSDEFDFKNIVNEIHAPSVKPMQLP